MEPYNLISKQTAREEGVNISAVYAKGLSHLTPWCQSQHREETQEARALCTTAKAEKKLANEQ